MRIASGYEQRRTRIELLPMIDVVFLLLVFFIYAMLSMVVHRGMEVTLPPAATAAVDARDYVSITLTDANLIYLDRQQVTLEQLPRLILERLQTEPDLPVYVAGHEQADFGLAIRVLDRLRAAGIEQVSFEAVELDAP